MDSKTDFTHGIDCNWKDFIKELREQVKQDIQSSDDTGCGCDSCTIK